MRAMKMVMRRWSRMSADRGMSTAEYAVGTGLIWGSWLI